jgi:hypothetical protein|eukprot:1298154-Prymnesium_polylepis.1
MTHTLIAWSTGGADNYFSALVHGASVLSICRTKVRPLSGPDSGLSRPDSGPSRPDSGPSRPDSGQPTLTSRDCVRTRQQTVVF